MTSGGDGGDGGDADAADRDALGWGTGSASSGEDSDATVGQTSARAQVMLQRTGSRGRGGHTDGRSRAGQRHLTHPPAAATTLRDSLRLPSIRRQAGSGVEAGAVASAMRSSARAARGSARHGGAAEGDAATGASDGAVAAAAAAAAAASAVASAVASAAAATAAAAAAIAAPEAKRVAVFWGQAEAGGGCESKRGRDPRAPSPLVSARAASPRQHEAAAEPDGGATAASWSPRAWVPVLDEGSGRMYFHHPSTGAARWEAPSWVREVDEATGAPYYVHVGTGESTWDPPNDYLARG